MSSRRLPAVLGLLLAAHFCPSPHPLTDRAHAQAQPCTVTVHGIELTQSIQKQPFQIGGQPAEGDAVTLVAGRSTTARVYVTSSCAQDQVVAWLNLTRTPGSAGPPSSAEGVSGPITPPTSVDDLDDVRSADDGRSFVGKFRLSGVLGDQTYDLKTFACSIRPVSPPLTNPCKTLFDARTRLPATLWSQGGSGVAVMTQQVFVQRNMPRIVGFPVEQLNPPPNPNGETTGPASALIQPGTADQIMRAVIPLPYNHGSSPYIVDTSIKVDPLPAGGLPSPRWLSRDMWMTDVLAPRLCDFKGSTEEREGHELPVDYLIALAPQGIFWPDGSGNAGQAGRYIAVVEIVPGSNYKTTLAHEVFHAIGFEHTDSMGTTQDIGWDTYKTPGYGSLRVRKFSLIDLIQDGSQTQNDGTRWMSKENTNDAISKTALYARTNCVDRKPPNPNPENPQDPLDFLFISAFAHDEPPFESEISLITTHHGAEDLTPLPIDQHAVRLVDAMGIELYATGMVQASAGVTASGHHITVPDMSNIARIELLRNNVLQDIITRSPHAPSVTLLSPASSFTLTNTTTISWEGADADNDALVYDVFWRPTNAEHAWKPLILGTVTSTLTVATSDLPAGAQGSLKVVARDGLNKSESVRNNLVLTNHPPSIAIVFPRSGDEFQRGEFIEFLSQSRDVDQPGELVPSVTWSSNIDGVLSTDGDPFLSGGLPDVNTATPFLSVGIHELTVTACDNLGACASESVTIEVTF